MVSAILFVLSRVLLAAIGVGLLGIPASAHTTTVLDPDDSPGPLDTVASRAKHDTTFATFKLITYETWSSDRVEGGNNFITIEFDFDADRQPDRCFDVTSPDGASLVGQMYTVGCALVLGDPKGPPLPVARPDNHSLKAEIPRRLIGKDRRSYRWRTVTSFEAADYSGCPKPESPPPESRYGVCKDFTRLRTLKL